MNKVKITVLKREFYPEIANEYLTEGESVGACPLLEVGDSFMYEGSAEMPKGFCAWAWIDIYRAVSNMASGGTTYPWTKYEDKRIECCTDGVRPVIFLLERIEEEVEE